MASSQTGLQGALVLTTGICLGLTLPAFVLGRVGLGLFAMLGVLGAFTLSGPAIFKALKTFAGRSEGRVYGGIALVFLFTAFLSSDLAESLETWLRATVLLPLGMGLVVALRDRPAMFSAALQALISGSLLVLVAGFYTLYVDGQPLFSFGQQIGKKIDPNNFFLPIAALMACCLPLFCWAAQQWTGGWRAAALSTLPLTLALIWGNGGQPNIAAFGGLVGALLCIAAVALSVRLPKGVVITALVGLGLAAIAAAGLLLESLPTPESVKGEAAGLPGLDWHREVIWGFAYDVFKDNWLTGVGLNAITGAPGASDIIPGMNQEFIPGHPHNWVLEIAAEAGVLGLSAAVIGILVAILLAARKRQYGASWAVLAVIGIYWTSGLANFSVWSAWWNVVLVMCLAFLWAAIPAQEEQ